MAQNFGNVRFKDMVVSEPDPSPTVIPLPSSHQERVNTEMFKAIEILGRKLERVEGERDQLARRLALIESSATVDKKTGRLYLPVAVGSDRIAQNDTPQSMPKWIAFASVFSSAVAFFALGLVVFREPPPALTEQQWAALNTLAMAQQQAMQSSSQTDQDIKISGLEKLPAEEEPPSDLSLSTLPDDDNSIAAVEDPITPPPSEATDTSQQSADVQVSTPAETFDDLTQPETTAAQVVTPDTDTPTQSQPTSEEAAAATPESKPVTKKSAAKEKAQKEKVTAAKTKAPVPVTEEAVPDKIHQLQQRAEEGVPEAQHDLATLYASGKIVTQDYIQAIHWFEKAADGGVANAAYNLGVMSQQGLGMSKDVTKAINWYQKAADMGHPEAMYNLGIAYIEGVGVSRNPQKGISFFKKAANAGVSQAAFNLGVLYESDFIGSPDPKKALEWYEIAANAGHTEAQQAVDRLQKQSGGASLTSDEENATGDKAEEVSGEGDASPVDENENDPVSEIQKLLIQMGYLPSHGSTGRLDPVTEDAIRAWQRKNGLKVDGKPSDVVLKTLHERKFQQ